MKKIIIYLAMAMVFGFSSSTFATEIYSTDFESDLDSEWSGSTLISGNTNFTNFLGRLGNDTTTLYLSGLGSDTHAITLDFDLYVIDSWDGDSSTYGPDSFNIGGDYTNSWLLNTESDLLPFDSHSRDKYGYSGPTDDIYRGVTLNFIHEGDSLSLDFYGLGLQILGDESWGLDNVNVSSAPVPEPSTCILLGIGLFGMAYYRRKSVV